MKIVPILFAALSLLVASQGAFADPVVIKKLLESRFPEIKPDKITKSGYGGLWEIFAGSEIFYTDEKVSYVVLGHLMDAKSRENVTESRLRKLTAISFEQLPLDQAIKTVRGTGAKKIAVFADPYCGYCKKFEGDLLALQDVTIYTFLYPIIRPESSPTSKKIWCSADRVKAWQDLMLRNVEPSGEGTCQTPVDAVLAFGQKLRVNGTPTTFFEDGERISGAIPKEAIEAKMAAASTAKK